MVKDNQEIEDKVEIIELLKESKEQQAAMLTDKARVDQELGSCKPSFKNCRVLSRVSYSSRYNRHGR